MGVRLVVDGTGELVWQILFWHREYGEPPLRVILNEGRHMEIRSGGDEDEGYRYSTTTYEFNGETLIKEVETESRDCDGRLDTFNAFTATVLDGFCSDADPEIKFPLWERNKKGNYQRDYTAEAAGY
jgi:hypothetical protein